MSKRILISLASLLSFIVTAEAQQTIIRGVVSDSLTKESLPYVTILLENPRQVAQTNMYGEFEIILQAPPVSEVLHISYMGYKEKSVPFIVGKTNKLKIELVESDLILGELVVTAKKRYRRKNNPAVEFVRNVIAKNAEINPSAVYKHYDYERYEKIVMSWHDFKSDPKKEKLKILAEHRDTNAVTGKPSLPLSIKERLIATEVTGKHKKETVLALRSEGIDEKLSQSTVNNYLNMVFDEINIFQPSVYFLMRNFISPLAPTAPTFYKYYMSRDTIEYKGDKCIELKFVPYDKNSLGFEGKMYVTVDSTFFIHGVEMSFPNNMNLNFFSNTVIHQSFIRGEKGERIITQDDVYSKFTMFTERDRLAMDIHRMNSYDKYRFEPEEPLVAVEVPEEKKENLEFWKEHRHIPVSAQEEKVDVIASRLRRSAGYQFTEAMVLIFSEGYYRPGKVDKGLFDIGPLIHFYTSNELEGSRLAFGGITTPNMSKRFFIEGYAGYGFRDHKFKWNTALEYSFIDKKNTAYEFPVHSLRAEFNFDSYRFGREIGEHSDDNFFSSWSRGKDTTLIYTRNYQLKYTMERQDHLSLYATARHYRQYESRLMKFTADGSMPKFNMTELNITLRYAPGEKLVESKVRRRNIDKQTPVFELSHTVGVDFFGGDFRRNHTLFHFGKRFNVAPLGYIDADLNIGAEWNRVHYLLLPQPRTNMSYFLRSKTFSLMYPLEFMYDRYAHWDVSWYLNGWLLNKIPLLKHLKFREVITFRGIWGRLTDKNNPNINSSLLPFPLISSPMGVNPYMELSFGLENILKFFRVEYVYRLTYRNKQGFKDWGILGSIYFKF